MIISIIYLIFSFMLESIMSNYFTSTLSNISIFTTIYTLIAFAIIYPYFNNEKKYFILVLIFGILFDVLYTSTFLVNTFIFIVIGIIIKLLYNFLPSNYFMTNIISYISILIYHILSFVIINITSYANLDIIVLLKVIPSSIIMTLIYTTISYYLMRTIYNKFKIKGIK